MCVCRGADIQYSITELPWLCLVVNLKMDTSGALLAMGSSILPTDLSLFGVSGVLSLGQLK